MPTLVWRYLTALLSDRTSASGVAGAEARPMASLDRLTRMLRANWAGQRLLESACRIRPSGSNGAKSGVIPSSVLDTKAVNRCGSRFRVTVGRHPGQE
jgi:hypothetical protein